MNEQGERIGRRQAARVHRSAFRILDAEENPASAGIPGPEFRTAGGDQGRAAWRELNGIDVPGDAQSRVAESCRRARGQGKDAVAFEHFQWGALGGWRWW